MHSLVTSWRPCNLKISGTQNYMYMHRAKCRTMTDLDLSSVKKNLSIVSCNCHGFKNWPSYLPILLGLIILQEHWQSDSNCVSVVLWLMPSLVLMTQFCYMVDPFWVVPYSITKTWSVSSSKLKLFLIQSWLTATIDIVSLISIYLLTIILLLLMRKGNPRRFVWIYSYSFTWLCDCSW